VRQAHKAGCAFARDTAMTPVDEPFDIVIGCNAGYPLDLNVYQSVKGMSAAAQVVRPGGAILLAAECWDGIPEDGEYARMLRSATDYATLLESIRAPGAHRPDGWQVLIQAEIALKAEIHLYSHRLTAEQIESARLRPSPSIETTAADLLRRFGPEARICVMPEGPLATPYLRTP
jgi:lactate racemase